MTGLLPDSANAVAHARRVAAEFEFENGFPIPVAYLAKKCADENQIYTQAAYKRPLACVMIVGSCVGAERGLPHLAHDKSSTALPRHPPTHTRARSAELTTRRGRSCLKSTRQAIFWGTRLARRA